MTDPEILQFKASQKLLKPDQLKVENEFTDEKMLNIVFNGSKM